jgi:Glycosyl transferase family 11
MFQYAAARALAERQRTTLCVDVAEYVHGRNWSSYQLWRFPKLQLKSFIRQLASGWFAAAQQTLHSRAVKFEMKGLGFDPAVNGLSDNVILRGFFTSERYFVDYRELITSLFNISDFLCQNDIVTLTSRFSNRTPVSVHVRRGDYVGYPMFDIGNLEGYYRECFRRMLEYVPDAYFVIFSDDTDWCLRWPLLAEVDAVVIKQLRLPHRDMALMAWCRHHIITNSTFSWWGAWLGSNPAKRVLMPRRWLDRWSSQECGVNVPEWIEI